MGNKMLKLLLFIIGLYCNITILFGLIEIYLNEDNWINIINSVDSRENNILPNFLMDKIQEIIYQTPFCINEGIMDSNNLDPNCRQELRVSGSLRGFPVRGCNLNYIKGSQRLNFIHLPRVNGCSTTNIRSIYAGNSRSFGTGRDNFHPRVHHLDQ